MNSTHKIASIDKNADGSMTLHFADGTTGQLSASDIELQAFVISYLLQ